MRRVALIVSGVLHLGAIGFAALGPHLFARIEAPPEPAPGEEPILVDLAFLDVTDVTDIKATTDEAEAVPVKTASALKPEPAAEKEPLRIASKPSLKPKPAKNAPDKAKPKPTDKAETAPDAAPSEAARASARDSAGEASNKPRAQEETLMDLDDIAALVGVDEEPVARSRDTQADAAPEKAERTRRGAGLGTRLSISLRNALQAKLQRCWTPIAGAPEPEKYVVEVTFRLDRDGVITDGPRVVGAAAVNARTDPYWNQAALRAARAVNKCAPYDGLPQDAYETEWSEVHLTFDPSDMLAPKPRGDGGRSRP